MNTAHHNKIHNNHKIVTVSWQKSRLRCFSLEAGSLLSRAGSYNANVCSVILISCKDYLAHQNREENVNKNVKLKSFPSPATTPKI